MPTSNYPNGFNNGLTLRGVPVHMLYPGEVFWVNNSGVIAKQGVGGSDSNPGTYQKPLSTIDKALSLCTPSRGDVIVCMPGHSVTVTTDGGLALDVAGVAVLGLGTGTLRPKIVLDSAAAAAITVTAANVTLSGFVIEASFADITNAVDVTAAWFSLLDCEFTEEGANLNFVDYVSATGGDNTADGLRIEGCVGTAIDAGMNSPLNVAGDLDRLVMKDCLWVTDHANGLAMIQCATGKDLTDCLVQDNKYLSLKTSGDILIDNDTTANSGIVMGNVASHADTAGEVICDADGVGLFNNYASGVITASGYLLPAADS